jgi:hypothetical protein
MKSVLQFGSSSSSSSSSSSYCFVCVCVCVCARARGLSDGMDRFQSELQVIKRP